MEEASSVAKEVYHLYLLRFGQPPNQMQMQKFMYLVQRESLMGGELLFEEDFLAFRYGPILLSVRDAYMTGSLYKATAPLVSDMAKKQVNRILNKYGALSEFTLSSMLHGEFSWKCARRGQNYNEDGIIKLNISAMRVDAARALAEERFSKNN